MVHGKHDLHNLTVDTKQNINRLRDIRVRNTNTCGCMKTTFRNIRLKELKENM